MMNPIKAQFGNIDIYLFDQLVKGRIDPTHRILDAGCGGGRNLVYFLRQGYEVYGVDQNPKSVERVRKLAAELAPNLSPANFRSSSIEDLSHPDQSFDVVLSNAVLHFAENPKHFEAMLFSLWRVLKVDGMLFVRLASTIGIEKEIVDLGSGRYRNPDGSERYLVDQQMLLDYTSRLGGELIEPIKTTNVQGLRCMTTWCVKKVGGPV